MTSHYSTENFNCIKSDRSVQISLCAIKLLRVTENSSSGEKVWLLYWKPCRSVLVPGRKSLRPQRPEEECRSSRTQGERILGGGTGGREVLDDGGRPAERIKDRTFFVRLTSDMIAPPSSPCKPASVLRGTTRDSGKDGRRAFFKYKQHLPVCVWERERERRTCIQAHVYDYWILAQITYGNLFYGG